MRHFLRYIALIIACIFSLSLTAQIRYSGSLQTSLYAWENPAEQKLYDLYQGIQFKIAPASNPDLYFTTYMRFARQGDMRLSGNPVYQAGEDVYSWDDRLYNMYLNWNTAQNRLSFRVGRQFVYQGVINGTLDGLMVSGKPGDKLTLKFFGGLQATPTRDFNLRKWDEGNVLGGYFAYQLPAQNKVTLSYFQINRKDATVWQLIGASFSGKTGENLYYQAYYDHNLKSKEFQGMRYRLSYYWRQWSFSGEYNSQRPRIYEDSFFRVFSIKAYNQARGAVTYQLNRYQLGAQYIFTDIHFNESHQYIATIGNPWGLIGLVLQSGDAGKNAGAYGDIRYPLFPWLTLKLFGSYYNFERQTTQISEDAVAFSGGIIYRPLHFLSLEGELQQSANSFYDHDLRGLLRLNYFFGK